MRRAIAFSQIATNSTGDSGARSATGVGGPSSTRASTVWDEICPSAGTYGIVSVRSWYNTAPME